MDIWLYLRCSFEDDLILVTITICDHNHREQLCSPPHCNFAFVQHSHEPKQRQNQSWLRPISKIIPIPLTSLYCIFDKHVMNPVPTLVYQTPVVSVSIVPWMSLYTTMFGVGCFYHVIWRGLFGRVTILIITHYNVCVILLTAKAILSTRWWWYCLVATLWYPLNESRNVVLLTILNLMICGPWDQYLISVHHAKNT